MAWRDRPARSPAPPPASPRQLCIRLLLEWDRGQVYADELLHGTLERETLKPSDRAFLRETFFGILRHLSRLDFLLGRLRPATAPLDAETKAILRLGLYQLFQLRTPPHAAVNETVDLAGRARGLVNAVLRRAVREQTLLEDALAHASVPVQTSHPAFLHARWEKAWGAEKTRALCEWNNAPPDVAVRVNGLRVTPGELLRSAPGVAERHPSHPRALRMRRLPVSWLSGGLCYVQDPSTLLAVDLLAPQPGEVVLDACAAPGGKTTYLAELMRNSGRIVACDIFESRAVRLRENLHRLGIRNTAVHVVDILTAAGSAPLEDGAFDRILLDAPCSNTGVLRRRVDVRWRLSEEDFIRMPAQQFAMVRRLAPLLKVGGTLVYSTCSLEPEENDLLVARVLAEVPGLRHEESRRTLPFEDGVDGSFAARLTRVEA